MRVFLKSVLFYIFYLFAALISHLNLTRSRENILFHLRLKRKIFYQERIPTNQYLLILVSETLKLEVIQKIYTHPQGMSGCNVQAYFYWQFWKIRF